jgi:microcystin-dependent protein
MSEPYLGEIRMFAGNFAMNGWAVRDGQLLAIAQNTALYTILGTTYGGDGKTTFALPDLRGRVAINQGTGTGLSPYVLGQSGGAEKVTLPTGPLPPRPPLAVAASGESFSVVQPYLTLTFLIALVGIYPSRN